MYKVLDRESDKVIIYTYAYEKDGTKNPDLFAGFDCSKGLMYSETVATRQAYGPVSVQPGTLGGVIFGEVCR